LQIILAGQMQSHCSCIIGIIVYCIIIQQKDFIINLNIAHFTFNKHIKKKMVPYYLGKYLFTREPVLTGKVKYIFLKKKA